MSVLHQMVSREGYLYQKVSNFKSLFAIDPAHFSRYMGRRLSCHLSIRCDTIFFMVDIIARPISESTNADKVSGN